MLLPRTRRVEVLEEVLGHPEVAEQLMPRVSGDRTGGDPDSAAGEEHGQTNHHHRWITAVDDPLPGLEDGDYETGLGQGGLLDGCETSKLPFKYSIKIVFC